MADTAAATGLTVEQWDSKFFKEYIQDNRFAKYMGTGEGNLIQVKEDLTKKKGDKIHFALVNRLTNAAVTGTNTLEGNEEDMASRSHQLTVNKRRNGVRVPEMAEQRSAIPLRDAARSVLMDWAMEDTRDQVIAALASINGTAYGSASEAAKDAWLVDNADRVLFGAAKSNNSSNDHSASLANIDTTADKLTASALSLMKRIALTAEPEGAPGSGGRGSRILRRIRQPPVIPRPESGRDHHRRTTGSRPCRAEQSSVQGRRHRVGRHDRSGNPRDFDPVRRWRFSSSDVGPVYLCGAQAIGAGYAKRWKSVTETFDYGDKNGVATEAIYGIEKLTFGSGSGDTDDLKDHGVVTGFFSATADA
jgi:hypothetical protein